MLAMFLYIFNFIVYVCLRMSLSFYSVLCILFCCPIFLWTIMKLLSSLTIIVKVFISWLWFYVSSVTSLTQYIPLSRRRPRYKHLGKNLSVTFYTAWNLDVPTCISFLYFGGNIVKLRSWQRLLEYLCYFSMGSPECLETFITWIRGAHKLTVSKSRRNFTLFQRSIILTQCGKKIKISPKWVNYRNLGFGTKKSEDLSIMK